MSDKIQDNVNRSDSGLGSLGSESDSSPNQCSVHESEMSRSLCDSGLNRPKLPDGGGAKHSKVQTPKKYIVTYCGSVELDKRYAQPQFWKVILQWLVAEIKRSSRKHVVFLEIDNGLLNGICCETDGVLFQHDLFHLSKFSRTHQDTRCFAYLTKASETTFHCHVFQTADESLVVSIFTSIKENTKGNHKEGIVTSSQMSKPGHSVDSLSSEIPHVFPSSLFEVLYIGKIVVSNKKAPPTFIDDAVDRFQQYEDKKSQTEEDRQRHGSGVSVHSLPNNLEKSVNLKENELAKQTQSAAISHSNESNLSTDSGSDQGDVLLPPCEDIISTTSSSEGSLVAVDPQQSKQSSDISCSEESVEDVTAAPITKENSRTTAENLQRTALVNQHQTQSKKNRTMLLIIGRNEVSLVSPDRKRSILKTNFRDISFCSQGIKHPEYFGFISRDVNSSSFYCYVFRCATESVVEEVMQTLKMAFNAAFQHSGRTHMCELCPMHQLHKLAEEMDKQSYDQILEIIQKRIEQLNEKDQEEITQQLQVQSWKSPQEKAELYMILLRHMCEERQKNHTHISDPCKSPQTYEFTLTESAKNRHSKFDDLRKLAKRSLSESFETIKERVRHKSGEAMREIFKDKSGNSEDSPFKSTEDDESVTPVASPTPRESSSLFSFSPSPIPEESSPRLKERKKAGLLQEMQHHQHVSKHPPEREVCSDPEESHDRQPETPLKNMFLKANTTDESYMQPGLSKSLPSNVKQLRRRSSWRFNIFEKVVTPAKLTRSNSFIESNITHDEDPIPSSVGAEHAEKKTGDTVEKTDDMQERNKRRYRMLWKKAFLETLLLIRMKKNIKSLQSYFVVFGDRSIVTFKARQDDLSEKHIRLEYEEITPCLKEVTKVWDQMLHNPNRILVKFEKAKISQAVKDGVPRNKRGIIWQLLIEQHKLQNSSLLKEIPQLSLRYEDLLKQLTTHQHAILIDLGRTFPSHPYFSTQLGAGQLGLFNILKAYSLLDKEVGYCQGVSFVAGVLLMHMEEDQAFDTIRYLMFVLGFRRQYKPDMIALQIQMYQLSRLLHDNYRDLYDHFELHEVAPTLYAAPWFLTMFASQFPLGFVARVFDLIFLQGMEVVLKVALVVLGNHKELIKQCDSFEAIVDFLKSTLPGLGIIQMERVFNQVYSMDVNKQLNAYEVEYHVLQEEMITTPHRNDHDSVDSANHNLKRQNLELLEQLQTAHSLNHSFEQQVHALHTSQAKMKSHIRTLELERAALLNTMSKIRKVVPKEQLEAAGIQIPVIPQNKTIMNSPIHSQSVTTMLQSPAGQGQGGGMSFSDLDQEVALLMNNMGVSTTTTVTTAKSTQQHMRPPRSTRRPSSSEN